MTNTVKKQPPLPLFDALAFFYESQPNDEQLVFPKDYAITREFLLAYKRSVPTFNAYRRETERLLQWAWHIKQCSITTLKRTDIEDYLAFCQMPPASWIGLHNCPRFIERSGLRCPNPKWRSYVVHVNKAARKKGIKLKRRDYQLSHSAVKDLLSILSTYYNYLVAEEYVDTNPILQMRQKGQLIQKNQQGRVVRRLDRTQWEAVFDAANRLAEKMPQKHERTLFMLTLLYGLYLRISELVASERHTPMMNDFIKDSEGRWWFKTVGKGNKSRNIVVSNAVLASLKRWRSYLELTALPSAAESVPLIPKYQGKGPITSASYVRELIQTCFDNATADLREQGKFEEADNLMAATVHWLRHTGYSDIYREIGT